MLLTSYSLDVFVSPCILPKVENAACVACSSGRLLYCSLLERQRKTEHSVGWATITVEQKDLPCEKLLNLNLPGEVGLVTK